MVAVDKHLFVTLAAGAPVSMLDADTGTTLKTFSTTRDATEILYTDGILVVLRAPPASPKNRRRPARREDSPVKDSFVGIDVKTGAVLWEKAGDVDCMSLASAGGKVFFVQGNHAVCLTLKDGQERWRVPYSFQRQGRIASNMGLIIPTQHVVLMVDRDSITALRTTSGQRVWEQSSRFIKSRTFASPQDAFVVEGVLWANMTGIGYDLLTGRKVRTTDNTVIGGHHHRCYMRKATSRYILASQNGVEFFDIQGKRPSKICNTFRGTCRLGFVPCNGLLYLPPNSCKCFTEAMLHGFYAMAPAARMHAARRSPRIQNRLETGPRYRDIPEPAGRTSQSRWPTYRHDSKRSGVSPARLSSKLKKAWVASLRSKVTPTVHADGKTFVALPEQHAVVCLDSANGKAVWKFTAGARIDSPPTFHKGALLFGSADGWVYSITADRGQLRWRYLCAPENRFIGAFDQLESAWPVSGSILVQNGVAYASAGRCSMVDGGIYLYALNPGDGRILHQAVERDPAIIAPRSGSTAYYTPGVLQDILVGDGQYVYLRHRKFDSKLVKQPDNHVPPTAVRHVLKTGLRLYASAGLVDPSLHHRTYWAVGANFGSIMAFDSNATYGSKMYAKRRGWSPHFAPAADGSLLYAAPTKEWQGEGTPARKSFEEHFPYDFTHAQQVIRVGAGVGQ